MSTSDSDPQFEAVTPRLPVADVEKALAFYVDKLGFQLGWKWGNPITHGNVCRGSINLDVICVPEVARGTAMAYVQIRGVDAYFPELKGRGLNRPDFPGSLRASVGLPREPKLVSIYA